MGCRTAALAAVEAGQPPNFMFGGGLLARWLTGPRVVRSMSGSWRP
jgi:hypothetical protein